MDGSHYHKCGECGIVWGHPDSTQDLVCGDEKDVETFRAAHRCPRGCPGSWREHFEPKTITKPYLVELGACCRGIENLFRMARAQEEIVVSYELIALIEDDFIEEAASWTVDLMRDQFGRYSEIYCEFLRRRNSHSPDGARCAECESRLMLFVELYNRS